MISLHIVLSFLICVTVAIDSLKYYEVINSPQVNRKIVRRSVRDGSTGSQSRIHEINFKALNRHFRLLVDPIKDDLFSKSFSVYQDNGDGSKQPVSIDVDQFLQGTVYGEPHSDVVAHFDADGSLVASVHLNTSHHISIEPAWRHLNDTSLGSSIVYTSHDVIRRHDDRQFGKSALRTCAHAIGSPRRLVSDVGSRRDQFMSLPQFSIANGDRIRRSLKYPTTPRNSRCTLKLVADTRFFEHFAKKDVRVAVNYLVNLIGRVNRIFLDTVFPVAEHHYTGLGFLIEEIIVKTEYFKCDGDECSKYFVDYNQKQLPAEWTAGDVLYLFGITEGVDYQTTGICLVHLFTHQHFAFGVLGLGFTPRGYSAGGICSPRSRAPASGGWGAKTTNSLFKAETLKRGLKVYPNTALSSSLNQNGNVVVTNEATLVTAHEFGHNWGSDHDIENNSLCSPSFKGGGNYLMFPFSVSGYDTNNDKFSPCSRANIGAVLAMKLDFCFQEMKKSLCGNLVVEEGEECDSGHLLNPVESNCCRRDCSFTKNSKCNPSNHGCCTEQCQPVVAGKTSKKCIDEVVGDCVQAGSCSGSIHCPKPTDKPNGDKCGHKGKCYAGVCRTVCHSIGLEQCLCEEAANQCKFCCKTSNKTVCQPYFAGLTDQTGASQNMNDDAHLAMQQNATCYRGFCRQESDGRMKCEPQQKDYLAKYWSFFKRLNASLFVKFMYDNLVGSIVIISLLVWIPISCCVDKVDREMRERQKRDDPDAYKLQFSHDVDKVVRVKGIKYADGRPSVTSAL